MSARPGIIVCETQRHWAVGIRRLLGERADLVETRSAKACWRELGNRPEAAVAWESSIAATSALAHNLIEQRRRFPRSVAVVLGVASKDPSQWLLRLAGAAHVGESLRDVPTLVSVFTRHFAATPPRRPDSLTDEIQARLPWASAASPKNEIKISSTEKE